MLPPRCCAAAKHSAAAQPTGGHAAEIISIDQVGDAAVAVLAEEGF